MSIAPSSPLQMSEASSPVASSDVPVTPSQRSGRHPSSARSVRSRATPGPALSMRSGASGGGGLGASSPLSLLRASSRHSRSTPGSVGRSDLGRHSVRSARSQSFAGSQVDAGSEASGPYGRSGPSTFIWGTNVSVEETQRAFNDFFDEYVDPDRPTDGPFYHAYLERLLEREEFAVNLGARAGREEGGGARRERREREGARVGK